MKLNQNRKLPGKNSKVFEIKHTSNNPRIKEETQRYLEISWNLMKMKKNNIKFEMLLKQCLEGNEWHQKFILENKKRVKLMNKHSPSKLEEDKLKHKTRRKKIKMLEQKISEIKKQ